MEEYRVIIIGNILEEKVTNLNQDLTDERSTVADQGVCARHGVLLEGESPLHTRQGEVLAESKGVVVRQGLSRT